jgi:hypothetical protein
MNRKNLIKINEKNKVKKSYFKDLRKGLTFFIVAVFSIVIVSTFTLNANAGIFPKISPDSDSPFAKFTTPLIQVLLYLVMLGLSVAFIMGVGFLAVGHLGSAQGSKSKGLVMVIVSLVCALLILQSDTLLNYMTGIGKKAEFISLLPFVKMWSADKIESAKSLFNK